MLLQSKFPGAGRLRIARAGSLVGLFLAGTAFAAGPPIPFDGYTVGAGNITDPFTGDTIAHAGGVISATCPAGPVGVTITCSEVLQDEGMYQRRVTIEGAAPTVNGTYVQFILTDPGVSGDPTASPFTAARGTLNFTNEDFVKMNNRINGIASKQTLIDSNFTSPTLEDRFVNSFRYDYGWAQNNANPWVQVMQDISQVDYSVDALNPSQIMGQHAEVTSNSAPGFTDNLKVVVEQTTDLSEAGEGTGVEGFKYVRAIGIYQPLSNPIDPILPGGTNGGSVTWNAFDELKALWIGQVLDSTSNGGISQALGLTEYTAVDPNFLIETSTKLVNFADTTAVNWNLLTASLGAVPTLPSVPIIVTPTFNAGAPAPLTATIAAGSAPAPVVPLDWLDPLDVNYVYNQWTVASGTFTASCPVLPSHTVVCAPSGINEKGMFQRLVTIDGVEYIQTIVTDETASGNPTAQDFTAGYLAFKDENFVLRNSAGSGGIADNFHIAEEDTSYQSQNPGSWPNPVSLPSTAGQFTYNTALKTGWAFVGGNDVKMRVDQRLLTVDDQFNNVSSNDYDFHMLQGASDIDRVIWFSDAVGTVTGPGGFDNPVMFSTVKVTGVFQDTAHSLLDPDLLPSIGGNIAWGNWDAIQATWVGGDYIASDPFGPSIVGTTSYTNLTTGDRIAATDIVTTPPDPETWVSPFSAYLTPSYSATYVPPPF